MLGSMVCDLSGRVANVGESDWVVRSDQPLGISGLCLEMDFVLCLYLLICQMNVGYGEVIFLELFVGVLDYVAVIDNAFGYQAEVHEKVLLCLFSGWQIDLFSQSPPTPDYVCFCCLCACLNGCVQASVFEVGWVNEVDVSYLRARMLMALGLGEMGFVMMLASTSCGEIEIWMGFDSSDVCLMANDGHHASASQSLPCQAALDLYYAHELPLSSPSGVTLTSFACDLDFGRAVCRPNRRQLGV